MYKDLEKKEAEIHDRIGALDREVGEKLSAASTKLASRLETDALVRDSIRAAMDNVSSNLKEDIRASDFLKVSALIAEVKLFLDQKSHPHGNIAFETVHPFDVQLLQYQLDSLVLPYERDLIAGRLKPERLRAIMLLLRGLLERAKGTDHNARRLFELAIELDSKLPDAYVLLALMYWSKVTLIPGGSVAAEGWGTVKDLEKEIDSLLTTALTLPAADASLTLRRARPFAAEFSKNYRDMEREADALIEQESSHFGFVDPRLHAYKARAIWLQTQIDGNQARRLDAAHSFMTAWQKDKEYFAALNNAIWYSTHATNEEEDILFVPTGDAAKPYEKLLNSLPYMLDLFRRHLWVEHYPELLNTAAEGYAALAQVSAEYRELARELAQKSVRLGRSLHKPPKLINALEERKKLIEKKCLEAEKGKATP